MPRPEFKPSIYRGSVKALPLGHKWKSSFSDIKIVFKDMFPNTHSYLKN